MSDFAGGALFPPLLGFLVSIGHLVFHLIRGEVAHPEGFPRGSLVMAAGAAGERGVDRVKGGGGYDW